MKYVWIATACAALMMFAMVTPACTKTNPEVCCTSTTDCASVGLPDTATCANGLTCSDHGCVAATCGSDGDCSGATPACANHLCVACDSSVGCTAMAPVCNLDTVACGACTAAADCSAYAATPACDTTSGACVQCATNADCGSAEPVCNATTHTCGQCSVDSDCPSQVCNVDTGVCIASSAVRYVSNTGSDGAPCTLTAPCSLTTAISGADASITIRMLPGNYNSNGAIIVPANKVVNLVATGAIDNVLPLSTIAPGAALSIRGIDSTSPLECLGSYAVTTGTPMPAVPSAITVRDSTLRATLTARVCTVIVTKTAMGGFSSVGDNTVTLDRISEGIDDATGSSSQPYIMLESTDKLSMTNSYFYGFGATPLIEQNHAISVDVAFNTFYDSQVLCDNPDTMVFENNIFYAPHITTGALINTQFGNCTFNHDLVYPFYVGSDQKAITGTDELTEDPKFVNAGSGNFHLQAGSPAIDAADPAATLNVDYDGVARPQGAHDDIGAFEYKP